MSFASGMLGIPFFSFNIFNYIDVWSGQSQASQHPFLAPGRLEDLGLYWFVLITVHIITNHYNGFCLRVLEWLLAGIKMGCEGRN